MSTKHGEISRRGFLSTSITGLVSAGLIGLTPKVILAQEDKKKQAAGGNIIYRKLGKTGIKVSIIGMGAAAAGSPAVIQAACEKGINHFDTAANYQFGRNEQMIGDVVSRLGVRDKVVIGTKILIGPQRDGLTPEALKQKATTLVEGSLKRLKTDYIDIVYVHDLSTVEAVRQPGLADAMKELKKSGKVRAIGLSSHANMAAILNEAKASGDWDVVVCSFNFTMADDTEMMAAIKGAADSGIGIVAMKTMAGGSRWPNPESRQNYSANTVAKAILRWVVNNEFISSAIPGFGNYDQLNDDFEIACNLEYTDEEKKLLGDNNIKLSLGFCRQCKTCLASCPNDTDIPTLMRTYMYAAQYGNFHLARTTLDQLSSSRGLKACADCGECVAQCANSVDIASRIAELKLIYA
jgi:predicted aldo/keto reductase-like oxidoreductase